MFCIYRSSIQKWFLRLINGRTFDFRAKVPTEPPPAPAIDLELPVDPNEPTYCFCNQVSYGDMVACDNPNVCNTSFGPWLQSTLMCFIFILVLIHIHIYLAVQDRVVSLWLCGREGAAQGKVVLLKLCGIPEEAKRQMIFNPHAALLVCRQVVECCYVG